MRIHVTGNAGAGKTTLARELGKRLSLPVIHLDRVVWRPGWKKVPLAEKEQLLRRISEPASWLIEGVSGVIRQRADIVVFLDVPRHVCLWRCVRRNWAYLFRSRPELPDNCPEYLILPSLLKIVWQFPSIVGARICGEARQSSKYVVIQNQAALENWLNEFASSHAA
jgi:adenylate kinase family enzyme